ncbi:hypothetical protein [Amycolatopsis sp. NPDC003861]
MTSLRAVGDSDPPVAGLPGSDAELVAGNAEQFGVVFDRYAGVLHRYCAGRVGARWRRTSSPTCSAWRSSSGTGTTPAG